MSPPAPAPDLIWALLLALRRHLRESATVPPRLGLRLNPDGQPAVTPAADAAALLDIARDGAWTARIPLILEKPLAYTTAEARALVHDFRAAGVPLLVAHVVDERRGPLGR